MAGFKAALKSPLKPQLATPLLRALLGGGVQSIGGVAIGDAGIGIYSGFTLLWGDDFLSTPTRWTGNNTSGRYSSNSPTGGTRRINTSSARQLYIDPKYRGVSSSSPVDLGYDQISVASSIVDITASPTPAGLLPYLPTTYTGLGDGSNKPLLISACLDSWPHFMLSAAGDWMVSARIRMPSGVARGWWPAFWTTTIHNWPDYGEVDVAEFSKDASGNNSYVGVLHSSLTDGAGDSSATVVGATAVTADAWRVYAVKKQGTTLTFYDDHVTPGTMAQTGTYTNAQVSRVRGAHRIRLELAASSAWDASTFNIADWPKSFSVDWWQAWVTPTAYVPYASPTLLSNVNTTPGGSWTASVPSAASLYGSAPTIEEAYAAFDNDDTPGQETKANGLPGGMTVNLTTRAISGTVPTTRGGAVGILFAGSFSAGGQARQALQMFNVAPAEQASLFSSFSAIYADVISTAIAYADFHSGNLGPHTYTVSNDSGGWLTVAYGSGNQSATLSGTAPSSNQTVTITLSATNSVGQITTATRAITVAAATAFADNFNRADQNLEASANWTRVVEAGSLAGDFKIISNVLACNSSDTLGSMYLSPDLSSNRQYAAAKFRTPVSGFVCVQATNNSNYIGARRNSGTGVIEVFKRVAGALTAQAAFAETAGDTDEIRLEYISGVLAVKKNGVALTPTSGSLTVTSGPPVSTRTGIVSRLNGPNNPSLDDYSAGVIP